ncbi:unnamed protein product [Vitrella brassicaformis CCMP3155]|uniref:Uncharacterized protein n=1 Tax=Vitrella brassicaformis (strain CCMP3155) TaxID=1169540 RepID=A0A0G4FYG2_VITBC|nr:unnamed protein product [Vitrella brassicaformis CCMP3155]|eukprot:CEM20218.1 unnamed protein product [Vitrella brassicaformis CCMP3155]
MEEEPQPPKRKKKGIKERGKMCDGEDSDSVSGMEEEPQPPKRKKKGIKERGKEEAVYGDDDNDGDDDDSDDEDEPMDDGDEDEEDDEMAGDEEGDETKEERAADHLRKTTRATPGVVPSFDALPIQRSTVGVLRCQDHVTSLPGEREERRRRRELKRGGQV